MSASDPTTPGPTPGSVAPSASHPLATAPASLAPSPVAPAPVRRGTGLLVLGIIGVILLALVLLFVVVYLIAGLGIEAFALGGIMALVPLGIVFAGVRWIDRWEPEPRLAILFAFLWGAGLSVLLALIVGAEIDNVVNSVGGPGPAYEFVSAVIQAPIVEETGKGLGVLLLFWVARRHFDGPVDGIVYAAWVAGGFAFTENILYFGSQVIEAGRVDGSVIELFLIRGIMSPFAHVMFTSCVGLALGIAARRTGPIGGIGYFLLGLVPAIILHGFWNGALFFVNDFYGYYLLIQVPLFVGAVLLVRYLRRQETAMTRERLGEYAAAGWFHPDEIAVLATPSGRRQAIAWARARGTARQMREYIRQSTRLAFARERIVSGRGRPGAVADEPALLASVVAARAALATGGSAQTG